MDYPKRDGAYWRKRAEEVRALAETMQTPEARLRLLELSASYMKMATQAEDSAARSSAKDVPGLTPR